MRQPPGYLCVAERGNASLHYLAHGLIPVSFSRTQFLTDGTFFTEADVIDGDATLKTQTYDCDGISDWYETGLQVLIAARRRPACAHPVDLNIQRSVPLTSSQTSPLISGSPDISKYLSDDAVPIFGNLVGRPAAGLFVEISRAFSINDSGDLIRWQVRNLRQTSLSILQSLLQFTRFLPSLGIWRGAERLRNSLPSWPATPHSDVG